MEQFVCEILRMSKLEKHIFKPQIEKVNLTELIETIIKQVDCALFVTTDRILLEKACKNIMYSLYNEKVYIKLCQDTKQNHIEIQVINTEDKIEEENIRHIFPPFYRIEKPQNRYNGGTPYSEKFFESLLITCTIKNTERGDTIFNYHS